MKLQQLIYSILARIILDGLPAALQSCNKPMEKITGIMLNQDELKQSDATSLIPKVIVFNANTRARLNITFVGQARQISVTAIIEEKANDPVHAIMKEIGANYESALVCQDKMKDTCVMAYGNNGDVVTKTGSTIKNMTQAPVKGDTFTWMANLDRCEGFQYADSRKGDKVIRQYKYTFHKENCTLSMYKFYTPFYKYMNYPQSIPLYLVPYYYKYKLDKEFHLAIYGDATYAYWEGGKYAYQSFAGIKQSINTFEPACEAPVVTPRPTSAPEPQSPKTEKQKGTSPSKVFASVPDEMLLKQMIEATISALNPQSTNDSGKSALEFLDSIKSNPSIAQKKVLLSFRLISLSPHDLPASSTHFLGPLQLSGFQLLEYTIKNNSSDLLEAQRNDLNTQLENLLVSSGSTFKANYLRDGLSRCVTQAALLSWPAKWPTLLSSCLASPCNPCTLYFLWRIAEDVTVFFQPPEPQRRRDILNKLKSELPNILQYIYTCLQSIDSPDLCLVALRTLTTYIDWNTLDEGILTFLFTLLSKHMNQGGQTVDFWLQVKCISCDCLASIFSRRKPKIDEAEILTNVLRNPESIQSVINLTRFLRDILSEDKFDCTFFDLGKKCCSLLTKLAKFISNHDKFYILTVKVFEEQKDKLKEAEPLEQAILTELLEIYSHSCQPLSYVTFEFWKDFWKGKVPSLVINQTTKEINPLPAAIHDSLHIMAQSILSYFPQQIVKRATSSEIILYAFDSSEYEETFYPKYRTELIDILRALTSSFESLVLSFTIQLFNSLMSESINQLQLFSRDPSTKLNFCNWDILALILDAVTVKLSDPSKFVPQIEPCLESLLDESNQFMLSPLLLSHQLSCISALVPFLPHMSSRHTERIVNRILFLAQFKMEEITLSNSPLKHEVINLHGHACNAFVKLARRVPHLLVPYFNNICDHVERCKFTRLKMEVLNEGLILISNKFTNEQDQRAFIYHLIQQISWLAEFNMDLGSFVHFMGLTQPPSVSVEIFSNIPSCTSPDAGSVFQNSYSSVSPSAEVAMYHENRTTVLYNITLAMALMKRVENKCLLFPQMSPVFRSILQIITHLNNMWRPDFMLGGHIKCPELAAKLFAPATDVDRSHLLEYHLQSTDGKKPQSPYSRLQGFLWSLHETLYSFIGLACNALSPEIYGELNQMLDVLNSVVHLPAMKLKMVLKQFVRPLLLNLPIESTIYPLDGLNRIIIPFVEWLFSKMDEKWKNTRLANRIMTSASLESQSISKGNSSKSYSTSHLPDLSNVIDCFSSVSCVTPGELQFSRSRSGLLPNVANDRSDSVIKYNTCTRSDFNSSQTPAQLEAELIDDQSNRLLSREFVDLLMACFFAAPNSRKQQHNLQSTLAHDDTSQQGFNDVDMDTFDTTNNNDVTGKVPAALSELGRYLCCNHRATLVHTATGMLLWIDSVTVTKTCMIMKHLLKDLIDSKCIKSKSHVHYLVQNLCTALRYTEVDADATVSIMIGLLCSLYEAVCLMEYENEELKKEAMKDVFWLTSSTDADDWHKFEKAYVTPVIRGEAKVNEKKKKEAFKNLLINIISDNCT